MLSPILLTIVIFTPLVAILVAMAARLIRIRGDPDQTRATLRLGYWAIFGYSLCLFIVRYLPWWTPPHHQTIQGMHTMSAREWLWTTLPMWMLAVAVVVRLVRYRGNAKALRATLTLASAGIVAWSVSLWLAVHYIR